MTFGPGFFRLILAGLVVVTHLSRYRIGITAVMVFFILSGYWVTRMYCEKYRSTRNAPLDFYISRFLRLWPAFVVAVLFALALRWALGLEVDPMGFTALPLLGVAVHQHDPLGISWSLDVELQFYFMLPLLLFAAERARRATVVLVAALTVAAIWFNYTVLFETVFCYLPAFFAGMLIYLMRINAGPRAAILSLVLFLAAGWGMTLSPATVGFVTAPSMQAEIVRPGTMLWALTLTPFVAWNVRQHSTGFDRALGDLSYSLYLTHYPLVAAIGTLTGGFSSMQKVGMVILIATVALAFYGLIDRPIEIWRARLMKKRLARHA